MIELGDRISEAASTVHAPEPAAVKDVPLAVTKPVAVTQPPPPKPSAQTQAKPKATGTKSSKPKDPFDDDFEEF
jgi:hypothetical protein